MDLLRAEFTHLYIVILQLRKCICCWSCGTEVLMRICGVLFAATHVCTPMAYTASGMPTLQVDDCH